MTQVMSQQLASTKLRFIPLFQPVILDPHVQPDPTQRPTNGSKCPYRLGMGQLNLKFVFLGWFRVFKLITCVDRPTQPIIFKKKKHG